MPRLRIDPDAVAANTRLVAGLLAPHDIRLVGVTKACLGNWHVARAMVAGGAAALADSRAESIARLRRHIQDVELELLRAQVGGAAIGAFPGAERADLYHVSSVAQAEALLSLTAARPLRFCLAIETGDGREGIPLEQAAAEAVRLAALPGAAFSGIATNAACAGSAPSLARLRLFREAGEAVFRSVKPAFTREADAQDPSMIVSAGGSGLLALLLDNEGDAERDELFGWLTELRCGEALLLGGIPGGRDRGSQLPGASRDSFIIDAPVLEVARKDGRLQVLAGIGIQDIGAGRLAPLSPELSVAHATSDYLALSFGGDAAALPVLGDRLAFRPDYHALLAAMTSPFVEKEFSAEDPPVYSPPGSSVSEDSCSDS